MNQTHTSKHATCTVGNEIKNTSNNEKLINKKCVLSSAINQVRAEDLRLRPGSYGDKSMVLKESIFK